MKTKRLVCFLETTLLGVLGLLHEAPAQMNLEYGLFNSDYKQLVEDAVKEGVLLYRQDYLLEDSAGGRFAVGELPYFSNASGFCVLIDGGYVATQALLEPWTEDAAYEPYAAQYKGALSAAFQRSVDDVRWVEAKPLHPQKKEALPGNDWYQAEDSLFNGHGFVLDTEGGKKDGWLVWLAAQPAIGLDSTELNLVIYRHSMEIGPDADTCVIPGLRSKQTLLGAVYLNPVVTGVGTMEFRLVGPVVKMGEQWVLLRLASPKEEEKPTEPAVLTPVKVDEPATESTTEVPDTGKKKREKKDR